MILLAFDVDGTLDSSAGPVVWAKVLALASKCTEVVIGIVSPSGNRPKDSTPAYLSVSGTRADNLRMFAAAYPSALVRLYISDNGDLGEASAAGFAYIDRNEFARAL